jgi:hypothetical protein
MTEKRSGENCTDSKDFLKNVLQILRLGRKRNGRMLKG